MTMSLDETICAYFVNNLKTSDNNETDTLEQFKTALELLGKQLAETQIRQIKPSEGYPLIAAGNLTKKDVFVLAQFDGDFFQQLQMTKALILGPPCLVSCLRQNEPIPLGSSAIYTTAMRDLLVSASGITPQKKEELSKLINWMGGVYFQSFGHRTTHLISNTIKSNKYEQATLTEVPVMHVDWVQYVWDQSRKRQRESIRATDAEFDKYRLPTFFGANITCSGLDVARKEQVMRLVNENGGIYHRAFRSQVVDIVITEQSKTDTDKYKAAIRYKKDVLLPEWIFDSHSRGYALPTKKYEVRANKSVSTPTKSSGSGGRTSAPGDQTQLSDLSRISFVSGSRRMCSDMTTVNETLSSPSKELLKQATTSSGSSSGSGRSYQQVLADICPRQAKKAGPLLDGCCVYLSGFRTEEREKLNRILNTCGATRYDEANEGISHIIVGQLDDTEYRQWQRDGLVATVHVVRLEWLLESIRSGRLVNELAHRASLPQTREPDVASPASKRTLRSMNHSFKQPKQLPIKKKLFGGESETEIEPERQQEKPQDVDVDVDVELLNQYSQDQEPAAQLPPANTDVSMLLHPAASSTQMEIRPNRPSTAAAVALALPDLSASTLSIDFDKLDYFTGVSVYVHKESFNTEFYTQMLSECEAAHGLLVPASFSDEVDYAIVSFEVPFAADSLPVRARHVVTELFLESCMKQNKLLPAEYYHLPVPLAASREPLQGMTIVVSLYSGLERDFINSVATLMGASVNKTFIKKEKPLLVCPTAEGSKYEGAIKWHYPVVTAVWLVQCAQAGEKLSFVGHLVGKSSADFPSISPRLKENNLRTPRRQERESEQQQQQQQQLSTVEEAENQPAAAAIPVSSAPAVQASVPAPELTPLRNRRVSELAGGGLRRGSSSSSSSPSDSPRTPTNQVYSQGYNFDFLEEFVERLDTDEGKDCVRQIIREMRENQTPELERIRRQACTPVSHQQPRPAPGIPEFCLTPEYKQRMADAFERRWRLPTQNIQPDTPIAVIRKRVMRITCETLGIAYDDMEEDQQQQQQPAGSNKNIRLQKLDFESKSPKTPKAAPMMMPKATPPRVSVSPLGGSPSASNFVPNTQSPVGLGAAAESTINFDKISFEETTTAAAAATAGPEPLNLHNSPDVKQITDYLRQCESRRNSLKRSHDSQLGSAESEVQFVQPFESEGFALGADDMVDWRDPGEFNAAKRRSSGSPRMQHAGTPCFSISCGDEEKRAELMDRIEQLGGKLCENLVNYDEACTHLLCERPNRGEKMLACIAAGKWILNIQYIEQCHTRGHFLDEAQYEWGNPRALNLPTLAPEESVIAVAAHRWRTELSATGGRSYSDHRVILSLHERSGAAIRNVLRAGGACILEPRSPFAQDPLAATATDCFVDIKKAPLPAKDLAHLRQCGVRIFTQLAINYYLTHGREANLEKYVVK